MATTSPSSLTSSGGSNPTDISNGIGLDTLIGTQGSDDVRDIIGFTSAGQVEAAQYVRPQTLDDLMSSLKASEDAVHDVTTFLGRPTKLGSMELASTDLPGQIIWQQSVENTIFAHPNFRMAREKLMGFFGFSATAVLKIVINPQPFEAGVYQLCYAPLFAPDDDKGLLWLMDIGADIPYDEWRLPFSSGLPSKLFNLDGASEVELRVPYVAPHAFFNLTNRDAHWGTFFLQPVCPLTTGTNGAKCGITFYMSFEDVKLFGAARPFDTQGPELIPLPPSNELAERQSTTSGPKISDVANAVSNIPFLPAVAPEVTMTAKAVGAIASQFGFSKPNADPNHSRMAITPYGQPQNVDATSNAFKMGTSEVQNSEIIPIGPTEEDEMSILSLVAKPQYHSRIGWTTSQNAGTELKYWPVNPNCEFSWSDAPGQYRFFPNRLCYIAQNFRYWRGTIRFTFHVAATKFHSGRLRFVYDLDSQQTPNINDVGYNFSRVIDIRGGTSFTIECPFYATTLFRAVPVQYDANVAANWFVTDSDIASQSFLENCLYCFVESPLRAPPNVSADVRIAVYVSAGSDFELACPMQSLSGVYNAPPHVAGQARDASYRDEDWSLPLNCTLEDTVDEDASHKRRKKVARRLFGKKSHTSQAPDPASIDDMTISMCGPLVPERVNDMRASEVAAGEKVLSLRELIKRYQRVGGETSDLGQGTYVIYPWMFPYNGDGNGVNQFSNSYFTRVRSLYRFYKGGMRYLFRAQNSVDPLFEAWFDPNPLVNNTTGRWPLYLGPLSNCSILQNSSGSPIPSAYINYMTTGSILPVEKHLQGGVEIQVPYYSRYPFAVSRSNSSSFGATYHEEYLNEIALGLHPTGLAYIGDYQLSSAGSYHVCLYQACADDFQMGFALGAPMCRYNASFT